MNYAMHVEIKKHKPKKGCYRMNVSVLSILIVPLCFVDMSTIEVAKLMK